MIGGSLFFFSGRPLANGRKIISWLVMVLISTKYDNIRRSPEKPYKY